MLIVLVSSYSVFEGMPIPYPKREFLTDDDNDDKADTGASKVGRLLYGMTLTSSYVKTCVCVFNLYVNMQYMCDLYVQNQSYVT